MKRVFVLSHAQARQGVADFARVAPDGCCVTFKERTRSLDQNAAQWPILDAFAKQLKWPVNGQMVHMTAEDWKDLLTAAFKQETARLAMGLNGGVVMLGARTSKFGVKVFSEWLEFLHAVAAERGVVVCREDAHAVPE